jgi:small subunit ribosomal protein S35
MSPSDREAAMLSSLHTQLSALDPDVVADAIRKGKQGIPFATDFSLEKDEDFDIEEDDKRKAAMGFWSEGEESMGPDDDYYGDDITSHGHGELQQHRDLREYARLIAWELPLLSRTYPTPPYHPYEFDMSLRSKTTDMFLRTRRPPLQPHNLHHQAFM